MFSNYPLKKLHPSCHYSLTKFRTRYIILSLEDYERMVFYDSALGYVFCGMAVSGGKIVLGKQRQDHKNSIEKFKITWIFEQAQKNRDLSDIFEVFKVA